MFHLAKYPEHGIECVQTRGEQYHKETRNPETCYAPITEDCFRRDLTINALYYDLQTREVVDFTGKGLNDIRNHVIRVTNDNPDVVFDDDPLRILRVVRFASRFGWGIEKRTLESMTAKSERLSIITQERITDEFTKILLGGKNPEDGIELLDEVVGLPRIIQEFGVLWGVAKKAPVFDRITAAVRCSRGDVCSRLAALLHVFRQDVVERILRSMKYSNDVAGEVLFLTDETLLSGVLFEQEFGKFKEYRNLGYEVSKLQHRCGSEELFWKYLKSQLAVGAANNENVEWFALVSDYIKEHGTRMYDYKLPVDGNDVMRVMGIGPSKTVGDVLDFCLHRAFEKNDLTREDCISQFELLRDFDKKKNNK
jgi:tRNA nucleotidyltransferase/poly(A) polymerase